MRRWWVLVAVLALTGCKGTPTVSGNVLVDEMVALPADGRLWVGLEDVSRADVPARLIASIERPLEGHQPPVPFAIALMDPASAKAATHCELRVRITSADGQLLFTNEARFEVISNGLMRTDVTVKRVKQD